MNASEYLRLDDKDEGVVKAYSEVNNLVITEAKRIWKAHSYDVNTTYKERYMNSKPFGTQFKVTLANDVADVVYQKMNANLLSRDKISANFKKSLVAGEVIDLGDAQVVDDSVMVNPSKPSFFEDDRIDLTIGFNLILPEDIEDEEDTDEQPELPQEG